MGNSRLSRDKYNEKRRASRASARNLRSDTPSVSHGPSPDRDIDEIIEDRKQEFTRRSLCDQSSIQVTIPVPGPFGILFLGDPHVDDPGSDIFSLERDLRLVRTTRGLYAACVGDVTNNWIGKLARLHGKQTTTAKEAWILAEWIFGTLGKKLLVCAGGNHDSWGGDGDVLAWITRQVGSVYQLDQVKMLLQAGDTDPFVGIIRHKWKGNSMWNAGHGLFRAAQKGERLDFLIGGHTHSSQIGVFKDPGQDRVISVMQVGSYKVYDDYPVREGMENANISPSGIMIFDPSSPSPTGKITMFLSSEMGAKYLTFLRQPFDGSQP